ncbi:MULTISPECIES: AMP-binding protein [unclassified Mycobacterium]|uniref:AMP-binding protein n=1 Tax=unclassified Mycobacterium TaxID=2642494 RepID=UPI00055E486A|nr:MULTISPECIES: AMP-binding protein [unclassified Mycobacterium]SEA59874.1 AMP-binding enzyme C-terminal domain-containing protein [Mycobacterium sp. 283mftsu]
MTIQLDIATLHEGLAAEFADAPCIIADRTWTWEQTTDRTRRLAAVLRNNGIGGPRASSPCPPWQTGQDHVGILLYNSTEYLESLLGAFKASAVPFNINYRYTADELTYLLRDANPKALIYGADFAPIVAEVLPSLSHRPLLVQVGGKLLDGALDYTAAIETTEPEVFAPSPDDRNLLYTGGTTGKPKGVIWRSGDMVSGPFGVRAKDGRPLNLADAVARAKTLRGRVLPAPPLMHGAGMAVAMGGWLGGATVVIQPEPERFNARVLVDTLACQRVTSLCIVGDAFAAPIVADLEERGVNLPDLQLIVSAGAALRPQLKDRLRELVPQVRVTDLVASSEGMVGSKGGDTGTRIGSGRGAVVLSEDRTHLLAPGNDEIGWLASGGAIPLGYLDDAEKTAGTFVTVDGKRYSVPGDRARLLPDGDIEFLGRDATTINTGGEKVYADEVEAVVRSLPGVLDALVVGRHSDVWGQEVVALVQTADNVESADLKALCRVSLAGYKVPKQFIEVDAVRRHANGKPDYRWAAATAVRESDPS